MMQNVSVHPRCACTGLAIPHHNLGLQIAHGPLSTAIGLAAGTLLGFVCALTPVWSSPLRRAVALLTVGELLAFCGCVHVLCCAMLCRAVPCCAVQRRAVMFLYMFVH